MGIMGWGQLGDGVNWEHPTMEFHHEGDGMGRGQLGAPNLRVPPPWGSPGTGRGELGQDWVNWNGTG